MRDELISYETARVAKEKGFNLKVYNYFQIGTISKGVEEHSVKYINDINTTFKESAMFSRPTQSLLQRWLREKYDIHIDVKIDILLNIERGKYGNRVFKFPEKTIDVPLFFYHWETYEKALEAGLQQALKLI